MTEHKDGCCQFLRGSEKLSGWGGGCSDGIYIEELIVQFTKNDKLKSLHYVLEDGKTVDVIGKSKEDRLKMQLALNQIMGPELIEMLQQGVQPRVKIHCNGKRNMPIQEFLPHIGYTMRRVVLDAVTGEEIMPSD